MLARFASLIRIECACPAACRSVLDNAAGHYQSDITLIGDRDAIDAPHQRSRPPQRQRLSVDRGRSGADRRWRDVSDSAGRAAAVSGWRAADPRCRVRARGTLHAAAERGGDPAAVRRIRRHRSLRGAALGQSVLPQAEDQPARAQLHSERLKVNDKRGNPIEIAAAVVWRVANTAQAVFDVEDYEKYVTRAEPRPRSATSPRRYAYDHGETRWLGRADAARRSQDGSRGR